MSEPNDAPAPDPHAWLRAAFAELHTLWKAHQGAVTDNYDWMLQKEFIEAKRSIAQEVARSKANYLLGACQWWQARQHEYVSKRQRLRHLWQLLDRLNEAYSTERLLLGGGTLLGRRWWNLALRFDGAAEAPDKTVGDRFPHLRVVDIQEAEWTPLEETRRAFARVRSGGKLRVGLCCLSGSARTFFRPTRKLLHEKNTVGFLADGIRSPTPTSQPATGVGASIDPQYEQELRASVEWAREKKVHILCFPELCVCPGGLAVLRKEIQKDSAQLCLVVPGSYHVCGDAEHYSNVAPIWLVEDGSLRELPAYEKADPLVIAKGKPIKRGEIEVAGILDVAVFADDNGCEYIKEDIFEGTTARLLYTPVGVIAVAICKDFLLPQLTHLERLTNVADDVLVVSMNSTPSWFWPKAANDIGYLGAAVFYVNTPQMVPPTDSQTEIVFWHVPRVKTAAPKAVNNQREGTRVCLFRTAPTRTGPAPSENEVKFEEVSPEGRELCEFDLSHGKFMGLMTET